MDFTIFEQLAINGVLLGLVYGLVGLGLSLVMGVMGILNISHGILYVLGGFFSFLIVERIGYPPEVGICVAIASIFVVGVAIDRAFVGPVSYNEIRVLMITFGLAVIIGQIILLFTRGYPFSSRPLSSSTIVYGHLYAQSQMVISDAIGVVIAALTVLFLNKTKIGKALRMVSQDRESANILGVNTWKISAVSLGIGSSFAGIAGALLTPVYSNYPDFQWQVLTAAFVVVIVGGLGSVSGSMVAGLIYGVLETVGSYFIPAGSDILVLVLIVIIIMIRPSGLFGQKYRI